MSATCLPLSDQDRDLLRHFVRLVDEMSRSRFVERYRKQDHSISCKTGEDGEPLVTGPEYDWEDFQSFLTTFRQVAISRRETVYILRVIDAVAPYATPAFRVQLSGMRDILKQRLEANYSGMCFGGKTPTGQEVSLTTFEILDALVNGRIFHADKKHRPTLAFLDSTERWHYLWPVLFEFVIPVLRACLWLFHALRREGILDQSDYPVRCFEPVTD